MEVYRTLDGLLAAVRACRACDAHLPLGPRPVVQAGATARMLVVGQAPGAKVHASGVPWDDRSGERLRDWMGIDAETFDDKARIAILPMGYFYPGGGPRAAICRHGASAPSCGSIACSPSCRESSSPCSSARMGKPISCAARVMHR